MRILITLCILLSSLYSYSQHYELLDSYSSKYSNCEFALGDTVVIGTSLSQRNKPIAYKSIYYLDKQSQSFRNLRDDYSRKSGLIDKIYLNGNNSSFPNKTVIEISLESEEPLFIVVDEAIENKEIVIYPMEVGLNRFKPFNESTSTILLLKNQDISEEQKMNSYVEKTNPQKYSEWNDNEFLYHREKESFLDSINKLFQDTDLGDTMILILPMELGDYSFKTGEFPVVQSYYKYSESIYYPLSKERFNFVNFSQFSSIKVPEKKAEFFASTTQKSYEGTRSAYAILKIIPIDVKSELKTGGMNLGSSEYRMTEYNFKILELHCVDSPSLYYNYIGGSSIKSF